MGNTIGGKHTHIMLASSALPQMDEGITQGSSVAAATETASIPKPTKKKICCACPDTKRLRDECIVENGEAACSKWIQAHLQCLRAEGFDI